MRLFRSLGRGAGVLAWGLAALPALCLVPASLFDLGPDGSPRFSVFNVALAALDPHIWDCLQSSLMNAGAVTIASAFVGVRLARLATRRRFWGRPMLAALACAGLAAPPGLLAIGLRWWLAGGGNLPDADASWIGVMVLRLAWFWVTLVPLAPIAALAAASALGKVEPSWEDAARLEGASPRRIWRLLIGPTVRPEVARALAAVFVIALIEPGGPLVLGLRRTLGFQIVEAAVDPSIGQLTRASVLALGATLLTLLVRFLIGWWGGGETPGSSDDVRPISRAETSSMGAGLIRAWVLAFAAIVVWIPIVGMIVAAFHSGGGAVSLAAFRFVTSDFLTRRFLVNSALLGLGVLIVDLMLARAHTGRLTGRLLRLIEAVPPLALGVGALALPGVLRMAVQAGSGSHAVLLMLNQAIDLLDPLRTPGSALLLAVALTRLPLVARAAMGRRASLRPVLIDAALTLGATPKSARRTLPGRWLGVVPAAALFTLVRAATNITPAQVLAPTAETRTIGPALLALLDQPSGGFARGAALGVIAFAANLFVVAFAARRASGVPRTWLRP